MNFPAAEKRARWLFLAILILAGGLRLSLALVNRDSFDPHYETVVVPMLRGEDPKTPIGLYHPKLYHWTVVRLISALKVEVGPKAIVVGQLVNVVAGMATLLLLLAFIQKLPVDMGSKLLAFLLVALNPILISVNAMVSNDSFVILFSVASTLCAFHYFGAVTRAGRPVSFFLMLIFLAAAVSSKGNGLVLAVALASIALLNAWKFRGGGLPKRYLVDFCVIAGVAIGIANYQRVYAHHPAYKRVLTTTKVAPLDYRLEPPAVPALSPTGKAVLVRAFLTLPLLDLIVHPSNRTAAHTPAWERTGYAYEHMHSYWLQVFGNASYSRFHFWPVSWRPANKKVHRLGAALIFLNFFPLLLIAAGLFMGAKKMMSDVESREGVMLLVFGGFLLAGIRYYMVFPTMPFAKFTYLAPFLAASVYFHARGLMALNEYPRLRSATTLLALCLAAASVADISWLVYDLA